MPATFCMEIKMTCDICGLSEELISKQWYPLDHLQYGLSATLPESWINNSVDGCVHKACLEKKTKPLKRKRK